MKNIRPENTLCRIDLTVLRSQNKSHTICPKMTGTTVVGAIQLERLRSDHDAEILLIAKMSKEAAKIK